MIKSWSWLVIGVLTVLPVESQVDQTREAGAAGAPVVDTVTRLIESSCIFPDDKLFIRRLAYVESVDGTLDNTFREGYDGGIWQVLVVRAVRSTAA